MNREVGVRELRQGLSRYLARVKRGERLVVTQRNRPVAELRPLESELRGPVERLLAEGRLRPAAQDDLPGPVGIDLADPEAASRALASIREERG